MPGGSAPPALRGGNGGGGQRLGGADMVDTQLGEAVSDEALLTLNELDLLAVFGFVVTCTRSEALFGVVSLELEEEGAATRFEQVLVEALGGVISCC